ncbi:hypothetical protein Afil01_44070 [Actinorhabdospora filicis]|uniref:Aminoglycoside phosphotransferase domain-containing protein n=1 Tax=Actinorhabdospora filicis TaxID=1785913 RepID=A0A9W6SME4_9ACTN|nr:phosphotransferase [Actinorhabdospora filicis]GLZ79600.1 hypothetical protein Afil01_44070 [Actinorhabdospora filicis]
MAHSDATRPGEHVLPDGDLPALLDAFGLGGPVSVGYIAEGLMNRNWRLEISGGTFALKELLDASWAHGDHISGPDLTVNETARLGRLVGRLHLALNSGDIQALLGGAPEHPRANVTDPATAIAEARRFLAIVEGMPEPGEFDTAVAADLHHRIELIGRHASDRPVAQTSIGPVGWPHGDLQYRNLLWADGRITAVLDWDRIGARPLAEELVPTAQVQFGLADGRLDLERIAVFTTAYRAVIDLSDDALVDAVDRLWWKRMTDFWPLQWHYDKGDHGPDGIWTAGERQLAWWCHRRDTITRAVLGRT